MASFTIEPIAAKDAADTAHWPDFYALLGVAPGESEERLRSAINAAFQNATAHADHREMAIRFYNQMLAQKVLPQCRRILLEPPLRTFYDEQYQLHQGGSPEALPYNAFVKEAFKKNGGAANLVLSRDEMKLLPLVGNPLPAVESSGTSASTSPTGSVGSAASPARRFNPLLAAGAGLVAFVVLGGGALALRSNNASTDPGTSPTPSSRISGAPSGAGLNGASATATASSATKKEAPLLALHTLAQNGDFEDENLRGWKASNSGFFAEDNPDPKSGKRILTMWSGNATSSRVEQTVSGLTPGTYTLAAWTRRSGGQSRATMFVECDGQKRELIVPATLPWFHCQLQNVQVKGSQCVIGFEVESVKDKWMNVDAVEFFKQ